MKKILIEIRDLLLNLCNKSDLPRLIYAKEIANNYKVNLNKYGTNFGGWCIENTKFQEILHNADKNLFD